MRILLVEDEPASADFVERSLDAAGYSVTVARDGDEGEREVLHGGYDLLLLDVMLPGRDGLTVLAAVRAGDREVPVIMLTAKGEVEDKVAGLDRGADDYIVKPFSIDELLARVRAQLRTPLTVVRGQVELLDHERDPARRHDAVETVLREVDRMNRLVDEMLTLAASESTALVHPRAVGLADFVEDLRRDLPLFGERDYRVTGVASGTLRADPERLHQVLRNLIRNAVAVTDPGEPIGIAVTRRDGGLEFAVSDSGPGIPAAELERVFDRFHRTDAARDRGHGGTGLGLAIAQAIVRAHGGGIRAESTPAAGTTIRFWIPGYAAGT